MFSLRNKFEKASLVFDTDCICTVNSEIFARVLFSRNFAYAKFRENKILTN